MRRVPFVISQETKNGQIIEPMPSLNLFPNAPTARKLRRQEQDKGEIVHEVGYLGLTSAKSYKQRDTTLAADAILRGLVHSGDEGRYVVGQWLQRAFRAGYRVGRKLEKEERHRRHPLPLFDRKP